MADDFGFDAGFEFDVSDDERSGPAQAAWDFSDAKDEMARELRAANATSVDQKIRNALKSGGGGKSANARRRGDLDEDSDANGESESEESDDARLPGEEEEETDSDDEEFEEYASVA